MQVKINAIEKCVNSIVVELPEGLSNEEITRILQTAEEESKSMNDYIQILEGHFNFKIVEQNLKPVFVIENDFKINYIGKLSS